jgi:hypothetical protein
MRVVEIANNFLKLKNKNKNMKYSTLTDDQKLKIGEDLKKKIKTRKKLTYAQLSTLDKYMYTQACNIEKLREGRVNPIKAQYDSMEIAIDKEEQRLLRIEAGTELDYEDQTTSDIVDTIKKHSAKFPVDARIDNWKTPGWKNFKS